MHGLTRYAATVAVVTGAGSGIGRAVAIRLASEAAAVAVVDISADAASDVADEITKAGGSSHAYSFDVSDRAAWAEHVERAQTDLGPVRLLVNNAGVGSSGGIDSWDGDAFDRVLAVNVKGMIHGIAATSSQMRAAGGGAVVNVASLSGIYGVPGVTAYSASKGAIVALTRAAAMELAPSIRVNAIAPGKVITPMRAKMFGSDLTEEELTAIASGYPLNRIGECEDMAAAVAFLGGPDAANITGIVLPVEGGLLAGFNDPKV